MNELVDAGRLPGAAVQIIFGYVLSMLLLHELEGRSRADFARSRGRQLSRPQDGAELGWTSIPIFFLLSALITWEIVESTWELTS